MTTVLEVAVVVDAVVVLVDALAADVVDVTEPGTGVAPVDASLLPQPTSSPVTSAEPTNRAARVEEMEEGFTSHTMPVEPDDLLETSADGDEDAAGRQPSITVRQRMVLSCVSDDDQMSAADGSHVMSR